MENFVVSARKYRPQTFDSVVGQKSTTNTLKNAISTNQLAHAYLFCGPRGVGKTTCARIFAKTINCFNRTENMEACDECESCVAFNKSRSYNIHELDAASNNSVEDIRNLIEQVRIPPQLGKYSVYIIDEVHMLSSAAFNAFLKTLEEPPAHAHFVLATTEKHKILPTILSRCQIFDFNRIQVHDIVEHLQKISEKEGIKAEPEALNIIAQKADGALRDALSFYDQISSFAAGEITYNKVIENLNVLDYDYFFKLTDNFLEGKYSEALLSFNEILNNGFDALNFINGLSDHFRDLLVTKEPKTLELLEVGASIREKYKEQSKIASIPFLFQALKITSQCDIEYKTSKNKRLLVEIALLKLTNILQYLEDKQKGQTEEIKEQIKELEKRISQNPVTIKQTSVNNIQQPATKTVSIKDAMNGIAKPKTIEQTNSQVEEEKQENKTPQNQPFTQEQLEKKWLQYAEQFKKIQPRIYSSFKAYIPVLKENNNLQLSLSNQSQKEGIIKRKPDILKFLKRELQNDNIDLIPKVTDKPKKSTLPYTNEEKFEYLNNKNPNLTKLKEKFMLKT